MEGEGRDGALIADVEDDLPVHVEAVVEPLYLGRRHRGVAVGGHQQLPLGTLRQVMLVEAAAAGVGKLQRALVVTVDV